MVFKIICVVLSFVYFIDAVPVIIDTENFNDDWNYEIKPHSLPILNNTVRSHPLPSVSKRIFQITHHIQKIQPRRSKNIGDAVRSRVSCSACQIGVGLLINEVKKGSSFDAIKKKFVSLCTGLKIETLPVCTGIFEIYGPHVLPVLKASHLGALEVCSLVLGEICGDVQISNHQWSIDLPDTPKPNLSTSPLSQKGLPTLKVLHLSDTHFDPEYEPGSPSNCEEPLCCRSYSTPTKKEDIIPAGRWGAYKKCDSPAIIIENMLKHIAEEHPDIDYIIWTGDLPPHDIWNQTKESNLEIIQEVVQQMFEIFPRTPIFPALGNHESIPAGSFAPPWVKDEDQGISWLYGQVADNWKHWLPDISNNTVLHGGFYSVLLSPGLRLISLNTNYCHSLSWWLLVNSTDPAKELKWLVYELQEAENKGEKVHFIGHIPPGSSDCMKTWSENFYRIVNRYEDTIMAQFYGHSHADEFEIFYELPENSKKKRKPNRFWRRLRKNKKNVKFTGRATNVAYLGPSVTTFDNFNPAYRIYYVDGDHKDTTREVLDHETWTTDLEEANKDDNEPKWYKLYTAKDAYGLDSLRPPQWAKLIERMIDEGGLFDEFYKNYYRDSPTRPACNSKCKLQLLCDLKSGKSHERHQLCHDLEIEFAV